MIEIIRSRCALVLALSLFACKQHVAIDCKRLAAVPHASYAPSQALGEPSCAMVCEKGWLDCDGAEANGCETSTSGTAPHTTIEPGAFTACTTGCAAGFYDCDGELGNGCESTSACQ